MSEEPVFAARGVVKKFRGLTALGGVEFDIGRGEILGLIGPNGAGKTTLISLISGTLRPKVRVGPPPRPISETKSPRPMMRLATSPVHPVWCEAPRPAPVSPWKYSWKSTRSRQ